MPLQNALDGLATEPKQDDILTSLQGMLTELQQKYEGGAIALDAPTITAITSALESITAVVSGPVALDAPTLAALEDILVSGTVSLDATSLAALENIVVSGQVSLDSATLSALETITVQIASGQIVGLDPASLAALENITATVSGPIALDSATLTALENVIVSGSVALDAGTLSALENIVVSGQVSLDSATLSALENVTVSIANGQVVGLDAATLSALESVTATLSGPVALDSATLAALETITASISNWPADFPDSALLAKVEQVRVLLAAPLAVTGPLTDTQLRASSLDVTDELIEAAVQRRYGVLGIPKTSATAAYITSGDHTLITPPAGQRLRIFYVQIIPSSDNNNANEVIVKFAGQANGVAPYRSYVVGHWEMFEGATDQALIVNTETAEKVSVTVHYEVFT